MLVMGVTGERGRSTDLHVVVDIRPRPSTGPLVTLDEDSLSSSSSANTVDSSLVQVQNKSLIHSVVLIVSIKDNLAVALELSSKVLPPGLEVRGRSDDLVKVTAVVVRVKNDVGALAGDVVHDSGEVLHVSGVKRTGHGARVCTLHAELNAEGVVALRDEGLKQVSFVLTLKVFNLHQRRPGQGR
jgi:hypothetical protein